MNANVTVNGWTMIIIWNSTSKYVQFSHADALTVKRYSLRDASDHVYQFIEDPIAMRIFLALLASA
jgi:hypothetical protein